MHTSAGATPVMACIQRLATSLAQVYLGERDKLDLPLPSLPLDMSTFLMDE
jgi:CRISPR-associated protein Cas1